MTRSHMFVFPLVIKKMITKNMKNVNPDLSRLNRDSIGVNKNMNDIATTVFDTEGEYTFTDDSNHMGKVIVR